MINIQRDKLMHDNFIWFIENYDEIYNQYGKCYVLIKDRQIIYVCNELEIIIEKYNQIKDKEICNIQFCNGNETGYMTYV